MAELIDTIKEAAAQPAEASGDNHSFKAHPLKDQIEADKYARATEAAAQPRRGLRFSKLVPPGAA